MSILKPLYNICMYRRNWLLSAYMHGQQENMRVIKSMRFMRLNKSATIR